MTSEEQLIEHENSNPTLAVISILDNHFLHIKSHSTVEGMENHIAEHIECLNNPAVLELNKLKND